jgi:hypothetical protein
MTREARRIAFEEFAAELPDLIEELARDHEEILVEKEGRVYRIGAVDETVRVHNPDRFRRMLERNSGAMKTVDIEALERDLREERDHASDGRPI